MSSISVSNINISTSCAFYKADMLTEKTKKKLIELGIPITQGMTETEAKQKITKAEESKNCKNQTGNNRNDNEISSLLLKIKDLAKEVGVPVSASDSAKKILDNIKTRLDYLTGIVKPEDKETTKALQEFQERRTNLKNRFEQLKSSNERIFSAMNTLSETNKIFFGLS